MSGKTIHIFRSHEEAAVADAAASAIQTPQERIGETVALILRVYGVTRELLGKRKRNRKINIVRYK